MPNLIFYKYAIDYGQSIIYACDELELNYIIANLLESGIASGDIKIQIVILEN